MTTSEQSLILLQDIFPNVSRSILSAALQSAEDDIELASSIVLSGLSSTPVDEVQHSISDSKENTNEGDPLNELQVMFPTIDRTVIKSMFKRYDGIISDIITELLNVELLAGEDLDEQKEIVKSIRNNGNRDEPTKSLWKNSHDDLNDIIGLTLLKDKSTITEIYQRNHFNTVMTIISIIRSNLKSSTIKKMGNKVDSARRAKRIGGRVQSQRGFAHTTKSFQPVSRSNSEPIPKDLPQLTEIKDFKYDGHLPQVIEINNIISSNKEFNGINPAFVKELIVYYQGNVEQCVNLLLFLVSRGGIMNTFYNNSTIKDESDGSTGFITIKNGKPMREIQKITNDKRWQRQLFNETGNCNNGNKSAGNDIQLRNLFLDYKLDFHGFLPQEAIQVLNKAMKKWWAEELEQRELNNKNLNLVNVQFVKPLIVITGRGIHSVGGRSKVRTQVKKYLQLNNYVFWEEPSLFEVSGRKKEPKG